MFQKRNVSVQKPSFFVWLTSCFGALWFRFSQVPVALAIIMLFSCASVEPGENKQASAGSPDESRAPVCTNPAVIESSSTCSKLADTDTGDELCTVREHMADGKILSSGKLRNRARGLCAEECPVACLLTVHLVQDPPPGITEHLRAACEQGLAVACHYAGTLLLEEKSERDIIGRGELEAVVPIFRRGCDLQLASACRTLLSLEKIQQRREKLAVFEEDMPPPSDDDTLRMWTPRGKAVQEFTERFNALRRLIKQSREEARRRLERDRAQLTQ